MLSFEKDYVTLTLTESTFKMAHLKGGGQTPPKLVNVIKRDIKDTDENGYPAVVQSAYQSLNVKKAQGICILPSSVATTKNIEIPSIDEAEIKQIIDLQAGRHTPYSREEILIGYINIGVYQRNYTKILLIIVNREIIKKQLMMFDAAGVKVSQVVFAPEAKAAFYGHVLNLKDDDTPVGLIDIGKYTTDFVVEFAGKVIACRSIPMGLDHLLKEDGAREKLIGELSKSIDAYQSEDINKLPQSYILTSDDAKIKELQPLLEAKLKAGIKIVSYLDHLQAAQPVMLKIVSEYDDESFLDILSPMFVLPSIEVNLLPDEIREQRQIEEKGKQVMMSGVFAIILLLLVCSIFFAKIYFKNQYLDKVAAEYEAKRKQVDELEQISSNTRIIQNYLYSRMLSLDVITELYSNMPDEIYLKNLILEEDGGIRLQGISDTRSTAFAFITVLENSDLFKNAKMISSSAKKERGKDVSAFEISVRLESASDEEAEEVSLEQAAQGGGEEATATATTEK